MASKSRVLQLRGLGIKKLPEQIYEVIFIFFGRLYRYDYVTKTLSLQLAHTLRHLELGNNKLKSLPAFIGDFCCLKQLHLSDNQLGKLCITFNFLSDF